MDAEKRGLIAIVIAANAYGWGMIVKFFRCPKFHLDPDEMIGATGSRASDKNVPLRLREWLIFATCAAQL